jgi:hypothetical protein
MAFPQARREGIAIAPRASATLARLRLFHRAGAFS